MVKSRQHSERLRGLLMHMQAALEMRRYREGIADLREDYLNRMASSTAACPHGGRLAPGLWTLKERS